MTQGLRNALGLRTSMGHRNSMVLRNAMAFLAAMAIAACSASVEAPQEAQSQAPEEALAGAPLVQVREGALRGEKKSGANSELFVFKGVPFAAPPTGTLRWAAPVAPTSWEGERDATAFAPQCMQTGGLSSFLTAMIRGQGMSDVATEIAVKSVSAAKPPQRSEDCLYLNITTPSLSPETALPVMVWIHGGGHQSGASSTASYQSTALPEKGVVLVTINYRLNAFGYLAHPALSAENEEGVSGNYGLLDQIEALRWIQSNIAAFGGDPDNVTIFGESAGGQAVSEVMAAPMADGLYHKGILQSGVYSWNPLRLKQGFGVAPSAEAAGAAFLNVLGVSAEARPADLRALPAEDIVQAMRDHPQLGGAFLPVADGVVQPDRVLNVIQEGKTAPVPILLGYNAHEGSLFYEFFQRPTRLDLKYPAEFSARIERMRELFGDDAQTLFDLYGLNDPQNYRAAETDMLGDDSYGVHTRLLANAHAARGLPVYLYHFQRVPPSDTQTAGAHHAAEITFVFDTHAGLPKTDADDRLTDVMGTYWTNFAKTGSPNGETVPVWPAYETDNRQWQILNHEIRSEADLRKGKLDALENVLLRIMGQDQNQ